MKKVVSILLLKSLVSYIQIILRDGILLEIRLTLIDRTLSTLYMF